LGIGTLDMSADRDAQSRSIKYVASLNLGDNDSTTPMQYAMNVDLDNRSTNEKVDLDLTVELTSNQDEWE